MKHLSIYYRTFGWNEKETTIKLTYKVIKYVIYVIWQKWFVMIQQLLNYILTHAKISREMKNNLAYEICI